MPRRLTCDNGPSDPDAHSPNQLRSTENARTRVSRFEGQPPRTRSRRSACHTRPRTLDRRRRRCRRGGQVLWRRCSRSACRRCARFNTGATVGAGDGGGVCGGGSGLLGGAGGVGALADRAAAAVAAGVSSGGGRVRWRRAIVVRAAASSITIRSSRARRRAFSAARSRSTVRCF